MIRTKSEAWNDGYNSYLRGCHSSYCPYTEDDEYFYEWMSGWNTAKEHSNE